MQVIDVGAWTPYLEQELRAPYFVALLQRVGAARAAGTVYPPEERTFFALTATPPERVRAVILGQDITPCIDFGHLYARSCGVQFADATAAADYAALLDTLAARLGDDRAVHFHAHFSRIAYTKGGEKCHLTFADTAFGPPHAPLLALLKERHLAPTIICESAGTQAEDAAALAQGYAAL